jgi:hypothetical protein
MLRLFVLLLLVANGFFYAWSNGYLSQWGLAASTPREAFRLTEQIEPERIVIRQTDKPISPTPALSTTEPLQTPMTLPATTAVDTVASNTSTPATLAAAAPSPAPASPICLTAGAFNDKQSSVLKQALDSKLPNVRWRFDLTNVPARWIVYMGKYPNNSARDLKKTQLEQIKVPYEELNQALQQLIKQGVRTARVLQESPEEKAQILVVPAVDEANKTKLTAIYATLASQLADKTLQVCKN